MAILLEEIIFDILSKLPIKSLCRFKCVSKSFLALFSDPLFIKTQYHSQTQKDKLLVLRPINFKTSDFYLIDPETSTNNEKLTAKQLDFLKNWVRFIGTCNGLCCLYEPQGRIYFFYNPSTRESSKGVPTYMKEYDYPVTGYGFGYIPSIDDYKMVIVSNVTHVFSLRNNSRKTIHQHENICLRKGTPLNGTLHWLSYHPKKIVSFDLVEEKFKSFPPLPYYLKTNFSSLDVVDGCLCQLVTKNKHDSKINVFEFWVMKEYGVVDSWTRILISKEDLEKPIYQTEYLCFLLCLNGGMAFFSENGDGVFILCYQEMDGTWKEVEVDSLPARNRNLSYFCRLSYLCYVFTESLVSPNWYIGKAINDY